MPRTVLFSLLAVSLLVVALIVLRHPEQKHDDTAATHPPRPEYDASHAQAINQALSQAPIRQLTDPGKLPASLEGADHGVRLHLDTHGNLVVDGGLIRIFDFYLSALDDEALDKVLVRIHRALASQLSGPALAQARDLLRRYIDYRLALTRIDRPLPPSDEAASASVASQRLNQVRQLRQTYFSASESRGFFGLEDAEDEYMVQRLAITQDHQLSDAEKERQLAALELRLPEALRSLRHRATLDAETHTVTEKMKAEGASAEALYQLRAQALGAVAARNLEQLDAQQAQWQHRLQVFAEQRQQLAQAGLSEPQRQASLQALLESSFDALEQKRVIALQGGL